jgi:hypothetical protein
LNGLQFSPLLLPPSIQVPKCLIDLPILLALVQRLHVIAAHHEGFDQVCGMSKSLCLGGLLLYFFGQVLIELLLDGLDGFDDRQFGFGLGLDDIVQPLVFVPRGIHSVDGAETFCRDHMRFVAERGSLQDGKGELPREGLLGELEGGLVDDEDYFVLELVREFVLEVRDVAEMSSDVLEKLLMGEGRVVGDVYLGSEGDFCGHWWIIDSVFG